MIVLDCSYALALVMPDAVRPASVADVEASQLVAPPQWPLEMANALHRAVQRGRLMPAAAAQLARQMDNDDVGVEAEALPILDRYRGAQNHGLTADNASYPELAQRRRCGLATLDPRLAARARDLGIPVYE